MHRFEADYCLPPRPAPCPDSQGSRRTGLVGVPARLAPRNKFPQAIVDIIAPPLRTGVETFEIWNEAEMGEAHFRFVAPLGDLEDNLRALPLAFVFRKAQVGVQDLPDHFSVRNDLGQFLFAVMHVLVSIAEFVSQLVGAAFDFSRPPSANVDDGVEDL